MMAIGVIAVVMMVSRLRVTWRMVRPVRTAVSPKKCVAIVVPYFLFDLVLRSWLPLSASLSLSSSPASPTTAKKTSSREGCFSTYSTLVEDRDPVGKLFGLVQVLSGEQHGRAALGELLDGLPHLDARLRVQPGRRLVEEDDRRIPDETHRDVQTAAHATGVRRYPPGARLGQREAPQ